MPKPKGKRVNTDQSIKSLHSGKGRTDTGRSVKTNHSTSHQTKPRPVLEGITQNITERYLPMPKIQDKLERLFPDQPGLDFGLEVFLTQLLLQAKSSRLLRQRAVGAPGWRSIANSGVAKWRSVHLHSARVG